MGSAVFNLVAALLSGRLIDRYGGRVIALFDRAMRHPPEILPAG